MGRPARTWDVDEAFDKITKGDDSGKWSVRQFAKTVPVSAAAVSRALIQKYGHDWAGTTARKYGSLPWYLPAPHNNSVEASRSRFLLRREAGEELSAEDEGRLNGFLSRIPEGWVYAFDPTGHRGSGAWVYRKRFEWEQDGVHIFSNYMAREAWPEEPVC